jgi:hypothetical protein
MEGNGETRINAAFEKKKSICSDIWWTLVYLQWDRKSAYIANNNWWIHNFSIKSRMCGRYCWHMYRNMLSLLPKFVSAICLVIYSVTSLWVDWHWESADRSVGYNTLIVILYARFTVLSSMEWCTCVSKRDFNEALSNLPDISYRKGNVEND